MRLVGVTIAPEEKKWNLSVPLVTGVGPDRKYSREDQFKDPARVNFLAEQRNLATAKALKEYPEATHVYNVESYYLPQTASLVQLVKDYETMNLPSILGGATWAIFERQDGWTGISYYDKWATPEWQTITQSAGIRPVSSVGSVFIYPVSVWRRGVRFENSGFPNWFYYNNFCFNSKLMVLLDLDARFYRTWRDSDIPPPSRSGPSESKPSPSQP